MNYFFERRMPVKKVLASYLFTSVIACSLCLYGGYKAGEALTYLTGNCIGFQK